MTDMLQKTENVAKNVANENSQYLTEQWHKGELINGKKYYITFFDSEPFEATFRKFEAMFPYWNFEANGKQYCDENGYDCVKVIAPVPTFEEWQALNESDKRNAQSSIRFSIEAAILRELLKECRDIMDREGFAFIKVDDIKKAKDLIKKTDEVLK